MQNAQSTAPELFSGAFTIVREGESPRYACRPLVARSSERNTAYAVFIGQISLADNEIFKAALHDLIQNEPVKVILDFSELALTKSAIGILVGFAAGVHGHNKRLYLYRPSAQIRGVLQSLDLHRFFSVLAAEDDVIAALII